MTATEVVALRHDIHELNNMLHVILGMSSLLADDLADRPEQLELVEMIVNAGRRASELTASMSALAKHGHDGPPADDLS